MTCYFSPFSAYKNILGIPGEGLHSTRFMDTAIFDYIGAILVAIVLTFAIGKNNRGTYKFPFVLSTISTFIIAEVLHMLFGVPTNTLKFFGICS